MKSDRLKTSCALPAPYREGLVQAHYPTAGWSWTLRDVRGKVTFGIILIASTVTKKKQRGKAEVEKKGFEVYRLTENRWIR